MNRAASGMWYQVVSPPNMPWSRLSWVGKVHSATHQEATAIATRKAQVGTAGAAICSTSRGANFQASPAPASGITMHAAVIQASFSSPTEPISCSEMISSAKAIVSSERRAVPDGTADRGDLKHSGDV